ncbi:baseplate J/gp47 family protein [Nonlabens ulvanivorans]|uniref:DUF1735 domain-containing protein n=1 Tax=Nonlabens ulvanivorans TaxID=906888 RepID=A0A084JZ19_NONUL|nr:hypothetical protein [Nonlabens ulvanivorans]KEZ94203.1 hypothetical protein IL45_03370 [Nonlabens ulvanivorans]PRX13193.1 hypothetical protein LY02_02254 [Nonlabens ulvanivorans]
MKNIFKYLGVALAILMVSCEADPLIYNGNNNPLISFSSPSYNLEIVIDATGSLDVPVNSSSLSSTDRTVGVEVIVDDTTALAGSYSVPATVTIPANEYSGILTIDGTDIAGVDTSALTLVIGLTPGSGFTTGPNATISVFQVCPVDPAFFTGDYQMTHLVFNGFGVPTFGFGTVVTLSNSGGTSRTFPAPYAPDLGSFSAVTWEFGLSCNEVVWTATQDSGIGCAATPANIELSTADAAFGNGAYDPLNDASFTMNLVDDDADDCGARTNVSILMTKI